MAYKLVPRFGTLAYQELGGLNGVQEFIVEGMEPKTHIITKELQANILKAKDEVEEALRKAVDKLSAKRPSLGRMTFEDMFWIKEVKQNTSIPIRRLTNKDHWINTMIKDHKRKEEEAAKKAASEEE